MWWLVEAISSSSFRLKHFDSGFYVKCFRGGEDPRGTLHLRADIPWFGKNAFEFTVPYMGRDDYDDHGPFRLECASTKFHNALDDANKKASWVDGRLVDWPRVGPGDGGWLVGGCERQAGERLRAEGHIFLWDKVEVRMIVTLRLQSDENGHVCSCTTLAGEVIAQHNISSGDRLADIRPLLLAMLRDRRGITDLVLVTEGGDVLGHESDSKAITELLS